MIIKNSRGFRYLGNPREFYDLRLFQKVRISGRLEQTCDLSCLVYIDLLSSRYFRQTRHGHDITGQSYDEACTSRDLQVTNGNFKVSRSAQFCRVVCQAVLSLSNADRAVAEALSFQLSSLFLSVSSQNNSLTAVYFLNDLVQFILDASFQLVGVGEVVRLLYQTDNFLCQSDTALAAFCPNLGQSNA